jgi:polysaccharide export outer membrane protein
MVAGRETAKRCLVGSAQLRVKLSESDHVYTGDSHRGAARPTFPETSMAIRRVLGVCASFLALTIGGCADPDPTPVVDLQAFGGTPHQLASTAGTDIRGYASIEPGDAAYRLGANDRLRIIVYGQDKLSGEYLLGGDGSLAFPLVGQVPANAMTPKELEAALASRLEPEYLTGASVSIEVLTRRPFYVLGEVQKPGSYPHSSKLNVLNAVATAGGYTFRARTGSFYIKRTDDQGKLYRVRATPETPVKPGDVVEVLERYF